ncbi:MAG TPA: FxsA family protein [Devosia sp.]|jgi:UPF0716 protein FxsA|nr:FxsA family protein [Devosia sp.]
MGRLVLAGWVLLTLVEITLFILIGEAIGVVPTLLGVVLGSIAGALLVRWQGLSLLRDLQMSLQRGELPARRVGDAVFIGAGGFLLMVPGYFTDLVGLLLLLPPTRGLVYRLLGRWFRVATAAPAAAGGPELLDLKPSDWRER